MPKKRSIDICVECGDEAEIAAHGLCYKCYRQVERHAFGQRADWNPGQLRRQKMMAKAYAAMIQALLDFGAGTHTQANKLVKILGAYLPALSEYLGEKEPEEEGGSPNAEAPVNVNRKEGSRPYLVGKDFTDLGEETKTEMNVNGEDSSRSHVEARGEEPGRVNVNKERSSQSQQPETEQTVSEPAEANVNAEVTSRSQPAPKPSDPASVNVNKDDASRSQPEPQPEVRESGGVNVNAERRSHSPKDPRYFTKLKERTVKKKEARTMGREQAEAAILNVLGHDHFARMKDFRRNPLLATMTYSKLLHILNEGVRESKWARRGRTSGATWHLMESGVNMNTERNSSSQQEVPRAEEPRAECEAKARSARG